MSSGGDSGNEESKGGIFNAVADLSSPLNDALAPIKQAEAKGDTVSPMDPNWSRVYSILSNPDNSPELSATLSLKALASLKSGTPTYDSVWSLFQQDVRQMETEGKTGEAVSFLQGAITSKLTIGDSGTKSDGPRGEGVKGGSPAETLEIVTGKSDAEIAALSMDARMDLVKQFSTGIAGLSDDESGAQRAQYEQQMKRVMNSVNKADQGARTAENLDFSNVPERWNTVNVEQYFAQLELYSQKDLPKATDSLAGVISAPSTKGSQFETIFWDKFESYIAKLSDKRPGNERLNLGAADDSIQKVWNALPADDEAHRRVLQNMAAANGYELKAPGSGPRSLRTDGPNHFVAEGSMAEDGLKRYAVLDTGGAVTSGLPAPQQKSAGAVVTFV